MVAPFRDIGNITFYTSAFQISTLNIASEFDIDMDMNNGSIVNNIIYGESGEYDKVRGHSLTPRVYSSRSISSSIVSNSGNKSYHDKVQWESNNMVENNPVTMSESHSSNTWPLQVKHMVSAMSGV